MTPASSAAGSMLTLSPYAPPAWARAVANCPPRRFNLAQVPTPVHRWHLPGVPDGCEVYVKRDDLTGGAELSGNKVRKLTFLLADAGAEGAGCGVPPRAAEAFRANHAGRVRQPDDAVSPGRCQARRAGCSPGGGRVAWSPA